MEETQEILEEVADRNPALLQTVFAQRRASGQPPSRPAELLSWCTCHRCVQMPTARERVCCNQRPDQCHSIGPVRYEIFEIILLKRQYGALRKQVLEWLPKSESLTLSLAIE